MSLRTEPASKAGVSIHCFDAASLSAKHPALAKMQRNDAQWQLPEIPSADNQAKLLKLEKLLLAHERANVELTRQRDELEKRLRIQRKLINFLRSRLKTLNVRPDEENDRFELGERFQENDARRNRVKSLNNALMRIKGVDATVSISEPSAAKIDREEFLPIDDTEDRKMFLRHEISELQTEIRSWVSRMTRLANR